ncbi:hypothetical protein F5Y17DRAFT_45428 [Xylariaceae sp. FL0594]|nr:hypothetical protein F5Y17DRAFT_45428 [Xylariaceae sp. FL0594]
MAPIPVYTNSPITAVKPDGITPKTASLPQPMTAGQPEPSTSVASTPAASDYTAGAARPGAIPSLPYAPVQPTPTTPTTTSSPPEPQPGAVPTNGIPPPPKSGERYLPPTQTPGPASTPAVPTATARPYPHQLGIPPPTAPQPWQQRGTSTATQPSSSLTSTHLPPAASSAYAAGAPNLGHPSGYQQNTSASELDRYQRSAMERPDADDSGTGLDGVWGAAKKLAQQTGERLAAVENEVWKRINKE